MSGYVVMRRACCASIVHDDATGFTSASLDECVAEADRLREAQIRRDYIYWVGKYIGPDIVKVYTSVTEEERIRMHQRYYWLNGVYAQHNLKSS